MYWRVGLACFVVILHLTSFGSDALARGGVIGFGEAEQCTLACTLDQ